MESNHAEFMLEVLMRIATALEKKNAETRILAGVVEGVANRLEDVSSVCAISETSRPRTYK